MRKFIAAVAVCLVASMLAACGSTPVVIPKPTITPTQFFAAACPPVQSALALAPSFSATLSPTVEADVQLANPLVASLCAQGATVSVANVTQFANTAFPAANEVLQAAPSTLVSDTKKQQIGGAILLAQLAVDTVSAIVVNTTAAAPAASAASAPVAASQ